MNSGVVHRCIRQLLVISAMIVAIPAVSETLEHEEHADATASVGLKTMRQLARELVETGYYRKSIAVYEEIVRVRPDDARAQYELAATLAFLREYPRAVPPVEAAIRLEPDYLQAYRLAEILYLNLKRFPDAFAAARKAAELGDITAMFELWVYYDEGRGVDANEQKAFQWLKRAATHGHLGAMKFMEKTYREGRYGQNVDLQRADLWAQRLHAAAREAREERCREDC
ncbi:MAG: hypothetical protein GWN84_14675 [Gammaproteobacteria bacterium]|nr:hypothetical protein [Gammaproteobacteria bacterium]NIR84044.1 hypothetical protein [Gammaproteobacteria bacterium]NIR89188.1 hypothetical protein [Gammaproteobacteria bacterium]NIU04990.1 hypothetical protein [Gammaproteobacteria bacterium]NIV52156.1 hypothetical protein [Gammaproteobacteria bacterium]